MYPIPGEWEPTKHDSSNQPTENKHGVSEWIEI